MLIKNNIEVPDEWLYKPEYRLKYRETTAIKLADCGINIPKYWEHKSDMENKYR